MRELKFRAWDKTTSLMLYPQFKIGFEQLLSDKIHTKHGSSPSKMGGSLDYMYRSGCPIMQYTGLIDKNGREIYEGDIVSASIYTDEPPTITEVIEEKGCFLIEYEDSESDFVPIGWFVGVLEVIGNIHENPELLTAERPENESSSKD